MPYVKDMIDDCEFDTIYHEHLCYFSLTALEALFRRHGLAVSDVERLPIHGGSLRVFVRRPGSWEPCRERAVDLLAGGGRLGRHRPGAVRRASPAGRPRSGPSSSPCSRAEEREAHDRGLRRGGEGKHAAELLRHRAETLDFVVDRSTVKRGATCPASHLRIDPPERLLEEMPDYLLLLAWNFADEILAQQDEYRRRGGRFIVPVPVPEVV